MRLVNLILHGSNPFNMVYRFPHDFYFCWVDCIRSVLTVSDLWKEFFLHIFIKCSTTLPFLITTTAYWSKITYLPIFRAKYSWNMHIQRFLIFMPFSYENFVFWNLQFFELFYWSLGSSKNQGINPACSVSEICKVENPWQ